MSNIRATGRPIEVPRGTARSILITGCSSGIGRAAAITLHRSGWTVLATVRAAEDGERLLADGIKVLRLDQADGQSIERCLEAAATALDGQGLDAVFLNAGAAFPAAFEDLDLAVWQRQLTTNVAGPAALLAGALRGGLVRRGTKVIFCGSILGYVGMPMRSAYVASKFALEGVADTLRVELGPLGVSVTIIEPGAVQTAFRDNSLTNLRAMGVVPRPPYRKAYEALVERLGSEGPTTPDTVRADVVVRSLMKALKAKHPRPRYQVTTSAKLMRALHGILPVRAWDAIRRRSGSRELPEAE